MDNSTTVSFAPIINALLPYVIAAAGVVITALGAYAAALLKQKTGIQISQANLDLFERAAATQAGKWFAQADSAMAAKAIIDVRSTQLASMANTIISRLPDEAESIGMTPTKLQDMIAGQIGRLQASAGASTSPSA